LSTTIVPSRRVVVTPAAAMNASSGAYCSPKKQEFYNTKRS
jgi:hypothetical protein